MLSELLGLSLHFVFEFCGKDWSTKTVMLIADQLVRIIRAITLLAVGPFYGAVKNVKSLGFEATPNHEYLRRPFRDFSATVGIQYDYRYHTERLIDKQAVKPHAGGVIVVGGGKETEDKMKGTMERWQHKLGNFKFGVRTVINLLLSLQSYKLDFLCFVILQPGDTLIKALDNPLSANAAVIVGTPH
ncbi:hypothetical protein HDV00_012356 [Rhizophlyctis rosea]|nr:hypothetical protein HDV00_012356 [Rhizophlyctis rosea]